MRCGMMWCHVDILLLNFISNIFLPFRSKADCCITTKCNRLELNEITSQEMREQAVQHAQRKNEHRTDVNNEEACAIDTASQSPSSFIKSAGHLTTDEDKTTTLREDKSSLSTGAGIGVSIGAVTNTGKAEEKELLLQAGSVRYNGLEEPSVGGTGAKTAAKSTDGSGASKNPSPSTNAQREEGSSKAAQRIGGTLNQPLESARRSGTEAALSERGTPSAQREGD